MIKKISYCNTDMAQQLADLEKEIFGTAWNNELIKQKINNDTRKIWWSSTRGSIKSAC